MLWQDTLRRRVESRCGDPVEVFGPYGYQFGKWLDTEPGASQDGDVTEVRFAVASYLGGAVREGRRMGTAIGVAAGVFGALAAFLLVWTLT